MAEDYTDVVESETPAPEVKREVREEKEETIHLLDQDQLTREEKLAQESKTAEQAGELELEERSWHKSRPEDLATVEAAVDAIGSGREAPAPGAKEEPHWEKSGAESPAPIGGAERQLLSKHLKAEVVAATVLYRSERSTVVEAEYRRGKSSEKTVLIVTGKKVRTVGQVASALDKIEVKREIPLPELGEPEPRRAPAPQANASQEPLPKEPRTSLRGLSARLPGRIPFGRKDRGEPSGEPTIAEPEKGSQSGEEGGAAKRKRFFRRG